MFCEAIRKRGVRGFRTVVALAGRKGGERRCNGGRGVWVWSSLPEAQGGRGAGGGSGGGGGGGDGVGVLVAEGVDRLGVAADVSAEADAVALLVAIAGAEVGDQEADFDAVAEGEPMEMEFDRGGVEGEVLVDGHRFDCSNASGGVEGMGIEKWGVASSDERAGVCPPRSLRGGARLGARGWAPLRMTGGGPP